MQPDALTGLPDGVVVLWTVALVAGRLVPLFVVAPFLGGAEVPLAIRVGLGLAAAVVLMPAIGAPLAEQVAQLPPVALGGLLAKELAVGGVLAVVASLPIWAAEGAGRLMDAARGGDASEVFAAPGGEPSTLLGGFTSLLAVVIFVAIDGHLLFLRALGASYEALPVAGGLAGAGVVDAMVAASGRLVGAAIGLAAPVLAAMLLVDLALGAIGRAAPEVAVYFVGLPARGLLAVLVLLLALVGIASVIAGEVRGALAGLEALLAGLR
jgi:flagellar biosynthesis protein FliR